MQKLFTSSCPIEVESNHLTPTQDSFKILIAGLSFQNRMAKTLSLRQSRIITPSIACAFGTVLYVLEYAGGKSLIQNLSVQTTTLQGMLQNLKSKGSQKVPFLMEPEF